MISHFSEKHRIAYLQNSPHHSSSDHGRPLGKPSNQLIEKLFSRDLEVDGIAAISDEVVEDVESEQGLIGIARIDVR